MECEDQVGGSFQETLTSILEHSKSIKDPIYIPISCIDTLLQWDIQQRTMGHPAAVDLN